MIFDALLSRRLVFLSGKGGVGKSTVGAALALAAHQRGRRVLLVEIDAPRNAAGLLGPVPVGPEETTIEPGLSAVNLVPTQVMDDYVRHTVRIGAFSRRIIESPIYSRFIAAAPGLKELMTLGKIMVFEQAREGLTRRPRYDMVIVDAPATGHGLSFLKVPLAASAAVPVGPVGHNARRILKLLRDGQRTALVIVTIPEEMAVVEAIQFHELARQEVGISVQALVLNACHERRFTPRQEAEILRRLAAGEDAPLAPGVRLGAALHAARRQLRRHKLTRFYRTRLRRRLTVPLVSLPDLFTDGMDAAGLKLLAGHLEKA